MENLNAKQIKNDFYSCLKFECFRCSHYTRKDCKNQVFCKVYALINEQEREIEKLERLCKLREQDCNDVTDELLRAEARIRELELVNVQEVRTVNGETFVTIKIKSEGN